MLMIKRNKPVECLQWDGSEERYSEIKEFAGDAVRYCTQTALEVTTPHGNAVCDLGDYVFKGGENDFYPVKASFVADNYVHVVPVPVQRDVLDHRVEGKGGGADDTRVCVIDEPGQGGACHWYQVRAGSMVLMDVKFQNGPIQEVGINGVQQEHLLAIVADRLRNFQAGPFSNRYNSVALTKTEEALMWLHRRTIDRIQRGVEGFNKA